MKDLLQLGECTIRIALLSDRFPEEILSSSQDIFYLSFHNRLHPVMFLWMPSFRFLDNHCSYLPYVYKVKFIHYTWSIALFTLESCRNLFITFICSIKAPNQAARDNHLYQRSSLPTKMADRKLCSIIIYIRATSLLAIYTLIMYPFLVSI